MRQAIQLGPEAVQGLQWETVRVTEDFIESRAVYGRHADGTPVYVMQKAPRGSREFLEALAQERNESDGKGWGNDKDGIPLVKIGSIPINVLYRDFQGRFDDQDFKKWWWSREENQPFRTRRGNL